MGNKVICPHCSRVAGRPGSPITLSPSCSLCCKDYVRVRAIAGLALRLKSVRGTPPEVMAKLFLKWAELTNESLATEAMKALQVKWAEEDEADEAERVARAARDEAAEKAYWKNKKRA